MISHSDTTRVLAQSGLVVIAPLHPADNFQDDSAAGTPRWFVDRARHVSRSIDYMTRRWTGRARLASGRIGLFGFSAGGTTVLISIGGKPNLASVAAHCARKPEYVCKIMSSLVVREVEVPHWTHDSRVDAAVLVAPSLGFTVAPSRLAKVKVPIQVWVGDADTMVPTAPTLRSSGHDFPCRSISTWCPALAICHSWSRAGRIVRRFSAGTCRALIARSFIKRSIGQSSRFSEVT